TIVLCSSKTTKTAGNKTSPEQARHNPKRGIMGLMPTSA
ncbi:hypothetical protein ACSSVY_004281, partial [Roseovarius sp. MBR-51]